jgi:hypothetical protein
VAFSAAHAHHAVQAQYDVGTVKHITGKLVKVEWINPHAWLHFEIKDEQGQLVVWQVETPGPAGMRRFGVTRNGYFTIGDTYGVDLIPARNGSTKGASLSIAFPDGRKLVIQPSDPGKLRTAP